MHGEARSRRPSRAERRQQIARRRMAAVGIVLSVVVVAIVAAYSIPSQRPGQVPENKAAVAFGASTERMSNHVVVASLEGEDLLLPVRQRASTAIAFHPVDEANCVALSPVGDRVSGGDLGTRLADIFAGGGNVQYYLMEGTGGERSASTAGLDVGSVPGESVFSPVDGRVTAVKRYKLLGRYQDVEIDIQLAADPSLLLVITHIARPRVHVGTDIVAGRTRIGDLRGFPADVDQHISQFTNDAGDHVQMMAVRVTPDLAGF
jgi:hypothetical protein